MAEQQIADLTETINKLCSGFDTLQASHEAQVALITSKITDETTQQIQKLESLGHRLKKIKIPAIDDLFTENTQEKLPEEPSQTNLPLFTENDDPIAHLNAFKAQMAVDGIEKEFWPIMFPNFLDATTTEWYYTLDDEYINTWARIAPTFIYRFRNAIPKPLPQEPLDSYNQGDNETFAKFLKRWMAMTSRTTSGLAETEVVARLLSDLSPTYKDRLLLHTIKCLRSLVTVGNKIDVDLHAEKLRWQN